MDRAEPAFKPEWLKSSSNGNSNHFASNNHHVGTSPHSDDQQGITIPSRTKLSSSSSSKSLSSRSSRIPDSKSQDSKIQESKSWAYSSFGSCRRERDRVRDYELQKDKQFSNRISNQILDRVSDRISDPGFEFNNQLRRSRSLVSNNGGIQSRSSSKMGSSFEKEFPSLRGGNHQNGLNGLTGRVSSPGINSVLVPLSGVESWNSVLVDVPHSSNTIAVANGSNGSNGSSGGNGAGWNGPVSPVSLGLNMAETVAQAPFRVRTPPQLIVDTQKIEERTLKQFKQLIPVTPSMPKSSVSSSLDKLKPKTPTISTPKSLPSPQSLSSLQPLTPKPASQIGNFQVLNRDKTVISNPSPPPVITSTKPLSSFPLKSPTKRTQSKDKLEFFKFIRNQSLGATSSSPPPDQDKVKEEEDKISEEVEKSLVISDQMSQNGETVQNEEMDLDPDPEEEAFLLSLGWDQNAEVDELTKEEIEAFIVKYKEVKQSS